MSPQRPAQPGWGCQESTGHRRRPTGRRTALILPGARPQLAPATWAPLSLLVPANQPQGQTRSPDISYSQPGPATSCPLLQDLPHPPPDKAEAANDQEFSSGQGPSVSSQVYGRAAVGWERGEGTLFCFRAT